MPGHHVGAVRKVVGACPQGVRGRAAFCHAAAPHTTPPQAQADLVEQLKRQAELRHAEPRRTNQLSRTVGWIASRVFTQTVLSAEGASHRIVAPNFPSVRSSVLQSYPIGYRARRPRLMGSKCVGLRLWRVIADRAMAPRAILTQKVRARGQYLVGVECLDEVPAHI